MKHIFFYKISSTQYKRVLTIKKRGNDYAVKTIRRACCFKTAGSRRKTQSGIILPDSAKEKPQTAVVIAVGPGSEKNGKKTEMQVKEGRPCDLFSVFRYRC